MLQACGLVLAVLSLVSYWLVTIPGEKVRAAPSNLVGAQPTFTVLLAGRDLQYCREASRDRSRPAVPCEGEARWSRRTDTIIVAVVREGRVDLISIPRDTAVLGRYERGTWWHKMNESYLWGGAEGLVRNAERLLGLSIGHYAIANLEFVENVVGSLGGLDVEFTAPYYYQDLAAGLIIDFPAGKLHLDGRDAVKYLRIRKGLGDDYARMDRSKDAVTQLVERAKGPAMLRTLPTLIGGLFSQVETNLTSGSLLAMLPHLRGLKMHSWTMPTVPGGRGLVAGSYLEQDDGGTRGLVDTVTNQKPAPLAGVPEARVTIVNSSGVTGLARTLAAYMTARGLPEPDVMTGAETGEPSSVLYPAWAGADAARYYADALGLPASQAASPPAAGAVVIRIGPDASERWATLAGMVGKLALAK